MRCYMNLITVIATIKCDPINVPYLKNQLCMLVKPTLAEDGVIEYKFYESTNEPGLFHSYEKWLGEYYIKNHLQSNHIKKYLNNTKNIVSYFKINYFKDAC